MGGCLFVGLLQLAACSSGATPQNDGNGGGDTAGGCTGSLSAVRLIWGTTLQCPDTYDATLDPAFGCVLSPSSVQAGLAGNVLVARFTINLSGGACYYDPTTRQLIGALKYEDTNAYCGNTSSVIRAGTAPGTCFGPVPSGCDLTRVDRVTDCQRPSVDAGADGG